MIEVPEELGLQSGLYSLSCYNWKSASSIIAEAATIGSSFRWELGAFSDSDPHSWEAGYQLGALEAVPDSNLAGHLPRRNSSPTHTRSTTSPSCCSFKKASSWRPGWQSLSAASYQHLRPGCSCAQSTPLDLQSCPGPGDAAQRPDSYSRSPHCHWESHPRS